MSNDIVLHEQRGIAPLSHFETPSSTKDIELIATLMVQSGFFDDIKSVSQAVMKIIAGAELGLGPVQSQKVIYFVKGSPSFATNFIAAQIKRNPFYDYRVVSTDNTECTLEFFERDDDNKLESRGTASFTIEEAQNAGLTGKWNWKNYTSDMLFNRALTRGARRYTPDAFGVLPIYTPEELNPDLKLSEEGDVIEGDVKETKNPEPTPRVDKAEELGGEVTKVEEIVVDPTRPWSDPKLDISTAKSTLYAYAIAEWGYTDAEQIRKTILDDKRWSESVTREDFDEIGKHLESVKPAVEDTKAA
jgi:hypothetical protein